MGGETARELGKLLGKSAGIVCVCVMLKIYSTGEE